MNKKALVIGLLVVIVIGVGAVFILGKNASAPASTTTASVQSPGSVGGVALAATITFTDDGFTPSAAVVKQGATVTVKNESKNPVQFSSDNHPTHTLEPEMNLRVLQPHESATFIITKVGSWGYHDHLDASKTGILTVTE